MKRTFSFTITNLLYGIELLRAPLRQGLFAQSYFEQQGEAEQVNRLCRVEFPGTKINHHFPGGQPLEETLLVGYCDYNGISELHLVIRGKGTYLTIAIGYSDSRKIDMQDEYAHAILLEKLTEKQVQQIFSAVWENPASIEPIKAPYPGD